MDGSVREKARNWFHLLFKGLSKPAEYPAAISMSKHPRVCSPLLALTGVPEEAWQPIWEEIAEGAERLGMCRAQLEIRSPLGLQTYHFESSSLVDEPKGLRWEATACLYVGSDLVGRMVFVGDQQEKGLSSHFEQIAELVERVENRVRERIVPEFITRRLSNELRLSAVA